MVISHEKHESLAGYILWYVGTFWLLPVARLCLSEKLQVNTVDLHMQLQLCEWQTAQSRYLWRQMVDLWSDITAEVSVLEQESEKSKENQDRAISASLAKLHDIYFVVVGNSDFCFTKYVVKPIVQGAPLILMS